MVSLSFLSNTQWSRCPSFETHNNTIFSQLIHIMVCQSSDIMIPRSIIWYIHTMASPSIIWYTLRFHSLSSDTHYSLTVSHVIHITFSPSVILYILWSHFQPSDTHCGSNVYWYTLLSNCPSSNTYNGLIVSHLIHFTVSLSSDTLCSHSQSIDKNYIPSVSHLINTMVSMSVIWYTFRSQCQSPDIPYALTLSH